MSTCGTRSGEHIWEDCSCEDSDCKVIICIWCEAVAAK